MIAYEPDEHVVAVWIDEKDTVLSWFLGVVESISTDEIYIKYYNRKPQRKDFCSHGD